MIILISQSCNFIVSLFLIQPFDKSLTSVIDFNEVVSSESSSNEDTIIKQSKNERLETLNYKSEDFNNDNQDNSVHERKKSKVIDIILDIDKVDEDNYQIKQSTRLNLKNAMFSKQNLIFFLLGICAYCKLKFFN